MATATDNPAHILQGTLNDHPGLPAGIDWKQHWAYMGRIQHDLPRFITNKEYRRRYFNPAWSDLPIEVRWHYENLDFIETTPVCSIARVEYDALPRAMQNRIAEKGKEWEYFMVCRRGVRAPEYWSVQNIAIWDGDKKKTYKGYGITKLYR